MTTTSATSRTPYDQGWEAFKHTFSERMKEITDAPLTWACNQMNVGIGDISAANFLNAFNPSGGLTYAMASMVTKLIVQMTFGKVGAEESLAMKAMKVAMSMFAGFGAGCLALAAAGIALNPGMLVALAVGTVAWNALYPVLGAVAKATIDAGIAAYDAIQTYRNASIHTSTVTV